MLDRTVAEARKLPEAEQDGIAARILVEFEDDSLSAEAIVRCAPSRQARGPGGRTVAGRQVRRAATSDVTDDFLGYFAALSAEVRAQAWRAYQGEA